MWSEAKKHVKLPEARMTRKNAPPGPAEGRQLCRHFVLDSKTPELPDNTHLLFEVTEIVVTCGNIPRKQTQDLPSLETDQQAQTIVPSV